MAEPDAAARFDDLSPEEVRVLGCLIEKEATTPDAYPLTLNGLRSACNQTSSRDPVVRYDDRDLERALAALRARGLTRTVHSTSNRATKYRHVVPGALGIDAAETAVLAVLLLRGAQTVGELKARTERQHAFASAEAVGAVLDALARRSLARRLERRPGQKDARWVHLLGAVEDAEPGEPAVPRTAPAAASGPADPYGEATAEFYDLLATAMWDTFGLQLLDLLAGVDPAAGPLVDVGSGTGAGLAYLLAAVPGVEVLAVEPSKAMRTALHARLAADGATRAATTVEPRRLADAALPERACAVVVSAVLGHLDDGERARLWRFCAAVLPPGAPAVVGVLPPARPEPVPATRYCSLPVGRYTYEGWQEGEPIDGRRMRWTMSYRVLDGDRLVAEQRAASVWRCDGVEDLRAEIAPYGLALVEHDDCVVVHRA